MTGHEIWIITSGSMSAVSAIFMTTASVHLIFRPFEELKEAWRIYKISGKVLLFSQASLTTAWATEPSDKAAPAPQKNEIAVEYQNKIEQNSAQWSDTVNSYHR